jgi:hypothetical protein
MRGISIKSLAAVGLASLACAGGAYASIGGLPGSGAQVNNGARKPSCLQLGADGRLHKLRIARHNVCTPTTFLRAFGATHWTLRLRRSLPKGTYVAFSLAIDSAGDIERPDSGDQSTFRVS